MQKQSYTVDVLFDKGKELVFISHLDLLRLFIRIFRKVDLPLVYSQGFNPHPKISFQRALRLGASARNERMSFRISEEINLIDIQKTINDELPQGVQIVSMKYRKAA